MLKIWVSGNENAQTFSDRAFENADFPLDFTRILFTENLKKKKTDNKCRYIFCLT